MKKKLRIESYNDWLGRFAKASIDNCDLYLDEVSFQCVMLTMEIFASKGVEISQEQAMKIVEYYGDVRIVLPMHLGSANCSLLKSSQLDLQTILDTVEGRPVNVLE